MMNDLFGASFQKPKPLGIPYQGSKRKYANDLINQMLIRKPSAKYFVDVFGGGGSMSFAALQKGLIVHYNEYDNCIYELMKFIFDCIRNPQSEFGILPRHFYEFISREKFIELQKEKSNYATFASTCYSFGNNRRSYLFSPVLEYQKHLAHDIIMFRCEKSLREFNNCNDTNLQFSDKDNWNDRRLDYREYLFNFHNKSRKGDIAGQLQQLQQLQQLERLQRLDSNISFSNLDYREVKITTPIEETIIYCDPPYRKTNGYKESINHDELDAWFNSLPFTAFMSEYTAPFTEIYSIKNVSRMSAIAPTAVIERLYVNR